MYRDSSPTPCADVQNALQGPQEQQPVLGHARIWSICPMLTTHSSGGDGSPSGWGRGISTPEVLNTNRQVPTRPHRYRGYHHCISSTEHPITWVWGFDRVVGEHQRGVLMRVFGVCHSNEEFNCHTPYLSLLPHLHSCASMCCAC